MTDNDPGHEAEILAAYAAEFLSHMPRALREECELLANLDPESRGVRVHRIPGAWQLVWCNRLLGTVFDEALVDRRR